jgi:aerotolerance regulator-like protein
VSFAAPGYLAAAFAVAAAVAALHLLVLRPPPASVLPTARFVPAAPSMVRRRTRWPQDRALLALRIATILLAGLGFARPTIATHRAPFARIVAVDRSAPAARDSAAHYLQPGDTLIAFDTSLSVALIAARRLAVALRADSLALVVVSPFATASLDAATSTLRAQWPAAIRAVRVAAAPPAATTATVHWLPPSGAVDTVGAVIADGLVAVAPYTRARSARPLVGAVIARWVDGEPAAVERAMAGGCERDVAIGMPDIPDVARLRAAITDRPCGFRSPSAPLSDSAVRAFAGAGALGAAFAGPNTRGDRLLMTVLIVLACVAALAEVVVRTP